MKTMTVAGVTFANEDGTNRQGILAGLVGAGKDIIGIRLVKQNYTDANNKTTLALGCIERTTGKQVGFIHNADIAEMLEKGITELTGFIGYNQKGHCYFIELSEVKAPSKNQYIMVKNTCARAGIEMPTYDVRAYKRWFANVLPAIEKTK